MYSASVCASRINMFLRKPRVVGIFDLWHSQHTYSCIRSHKTNYVPGVSARSSPILGSSSCGLGPNPSCATAPFREFPGVTAPEAGTGVPALELFTDVWPFLGCEPFRETGGADTGLVEMMCKAGNGLLLACGRTSSRFTGMPRVIRCCLLIRERVQFGGCADGGVFWMSDW